MRNRQLLILYAFLASGCSRSETSAPPYSIWDNQGVEVVQSNLPIRDDGGGWAVSAEPALTISTHPSNRDQVLHWVRGTVRLSDGRIAAISESAKSLMFFDEEGEFLASVGRPGVGPGDLQAPFQLTRLSGDTLVITDRSMTRVSWFSPTGAFLRLVQPDLNQLLHEIPDTLQVGDSRFIPPSNILWEVGSFSRVRIGERWRPQLEFLLTGADASNPVLLGWFPGREMYNTSTEVGRWAFFGRKTYAAAGGDPTQVYIGDSEGFSLQVFALDGRLLRVIGDAIPPTPISGEDVEWERREVLDWARRFGMYEQWVRFADAMPIPEEKPAFDHIVIDALGNLWAKEYSSYRPDPVRYRIYSPDGRRVGTVMLPGRLRVFDIGTDYILGLYLDTDFVETIHLYALQRPVR